MTTNPADNQLVTIVLLVLATVIAVPILFMSFGMLGSGPMMGGNGVLRRGAVEQRRGGCSPPDWRCSCCCSVAAVAAVYLLYRAITGTGDADRALEELRLAYARGDITDEGVRTAQRRSRTRFLTVVSPRAAAHRFPR